MTSGARYRPARLRSLRRANANRFSVAPAILPAWSPPPKAAGRIAGATLKLVPDSLREGYEPRVVAEGFQRRVDVEPGDGLAALGVELLEPGDGLVAVAEDGVDAGEEEGEGVAGGGVDLGHRGFGSGAVAGKTLDVAEAAM